MNRNQIIAMGVMFFCALLAAISQILLKKSTQMHHASTWREYANGHVMAAYGILAVTIVLNIFAYSVLNYKYGSIILSSSYVFTLLLSMVFLGDRPTWKCIVGNALIVLGIAVYVFV